MDDMAHGNWGHFTSERVIDEYFKDRYRFHPPFARFLTGITWKLFHKSLGEIRSLRLAPALLFTISVTLLYFLVAEYYGVAAGALASLALLLYPAPFGHAHLIALDSQIASMWFITAYCFIKGLESRAWAVGFGISLAFTMNTKIHGFAVPAPLFLWGVLFFRSKVIPNLLSFLIVTPVFLYLSNPMLWNDPFMDLYYFIRMMLKKKVYEPVGTHFMGERYSFSPPKYYAFLMTAITIPPLTLILALFGVFVAGTKEIKRFVTQKGSRGLGVFFTLNALTALCLTLFQNIPVYDGVRLFLPAFIFLAGLAGLGFFHLLQLAESAKIKTALSFGVGILTVGASAYSLIQIHPFELSYFNVFTGGLPGAKKSGIETTYWNDSFTLETARMMNEKYRNKVFSKVTGLRITFKYYKELGILDKSITQHESGYDYYLVQYRQGWFTPEAWFYTRYVTPEYSVQREGTPLFEIYKSLDALASEPKEFPAEENISPEGYEWRRFLIVSKAGLYRFCVFSNFNGALWVDGMVQQKNEPGTHSSLAEYEIHLDAGVHALKLLFPNAQKPHRFFFGNITPAGEKKLLS